MRAVVLLLVVACSASSGTSINSTPPPSPSSALPDRACARNEDCQWTSITHEIADKLDCACRACMTTIVNVETARRREDAYAKLCEFHKSEEGRSCPVVKCELPPHVACKSGECSR